MVLGIDAVRRIHDVTAVGQEVGPEMATLSWPIDGGDRNRGATRRRDAVERMLPARREHDDVIKVPRAAPALRRIAQNLRRAAGQRQSFQTAVCKKPD